MSWQDLLQVAVWISGLFGLLINFQMSCSTACANEDIFRGAARDLKSSLVVAF